MSDGMPRRAAYVCSFLATFGLLWPVPAVLGQDSTGDRIDGPPPPAPPATIARDEAGRVTVRTARLPSPIELDGRLDEPFYASVPPFDGFVQQEPEEGQPATEKTDAWVFFDEDDIFVAARLWETEPSRRVMSDMRRDSFNMYNNDHIAVIFDTFYDRRSGFGFSSNAQGGMFDWTATNEQPNPNWNGLWQVRAANFDGGWSVEFRIPFRSIRFRQDGTIWGVNFRRMVRWKNEQSYLSLVPQSWGRRGLNKISSSATMVDVEPPSKLRNLDVKPYVLGSSLTNLEASPAFRNDPNGEMGLDVKWGITQQLIADLTVNTDFAQVEEDEAQVNLTRFSLFFPERRDFFLEGQDVFSFGGAGGGGSWGGGGGGGGGGGFGGGGGGFGGGGGGGVGGGGNETPILFYSRRVGLDAGRVVPIVAGGRLLGRVGPWHLGAINMLTDDVSSVGVASTNFSVLRVNRDLLSRSRVGVIATARNPRAGIGTTGENYAYGADAQFGITNDLAVLGYAAATSTPGRSGNQTSYRGRFDYNADRYGLQLEHLFAGEDFNPEVGFMRRLAFRRSFGQARFSPRPARWAGVRRLFFETSVDYIEDTPAATLQSRELQGSYRMEFQNGDFYDVELTDSYEGLKAAFEVAPGVTVPAGGYDFTQVRTTYTVGAQRPISGSITARRGGFYGGTLTELSYRGRVEFSSRLYAEPTVSWNRVEGPYGRNSTNLASTRLTYTITPRMFTSALVQYQSASSSITTSARFRWEYQPGSDLFIVYTDGRDTASRGFPALVNRSFVLKITRLFRF